MTHMPEPWPHIEGRPIPLSEENYRRARLCVNALRGVPDDWLEAYNNPELEELFGPGMPIDESLRHWIQRAAKAEMELYTLKAKIKAAIA